MKYIKGYTYTYDYRYTRYNDAASRESLRLMKESTDCDTVILVFGALQDTAQSEEIDYSGEQMPTDEEVIEMICFAKSLGLRVILKPFVNCRDGTWRAHINFFDIDMPREPQWGNWFRNYTRYQVHFARIAELTGCEMIIIGCEMVMAQKREKNWRDLIAQIRAEYSGLLTYNADKYTEDHVTWWDAVDVISSSGYYPITDWEQELDRIEAVVRREGKPFFFAEAGCPSRDTSPLMPNAWDAKGELSLAAQTAYFQTMLAHCAARGFVSGFAFWDWSSNLYLLSDAKNDTGYAIYGKPAAQIVSDFYRGKKEGSGVS